MIKTLLREKKNVAVVAGVIIPALFAIVLYVLFRPASQIEATEMPSVDIEQQGHETAGDTAIETEDIQDETLAYLETEEPEKSDIQETVEETEEIVSGGLEENSEDKPNEKEEEEHSLEQTKYIGRQPPEGYVEPEGSSRHAFQLEYKDTYQSNIVVMWEEIWDIDYRDYAWFHPAYHKGPNTSGVGAYQFLVYAILAYYDGDVPCDYYFNFREDVHNRHPYSSVIYEVQMHGDRPLNICLDTYNYKIRVEEGIVKED
jgi:hypothetical protein